MARAGDWSRRRQAYQEGDQGECRVGLCALDGLESEETDGSHSVFGSVHCGVNNDLETISEVAEEDALSLGLFKNPQTQTHSPKAPQSVHSAILPPIAVFHHE